MCLRTVAFPVTLPLLLSMFNILVKQECKGFDHHNKFNSRQINYLLNHGGFTKTTKDLDESKDLTETPEDLAEIPEDLKEILPTLPTHHNTTGM
jgi:hypothetical protein